MIISNSTVILKATSQLKEYQKNTRRTHNISLFITQKTSMKKLESERSKFVE
jgi:hypothetical protein